VVMAQSTPFLSGSSDTPEAIVDLILNGVVRHSNPSSSSGGPSC
jgi:hypothetical protein